VAKATTEVPDATSVGGGIEAEHMFMRMRGVEQQHAIMFISCVLGTWLEENQPHMDFLTLIKI
jgi:GTP cyclohydrolase I